MKKIILYLSLLPITAIAEPLIITHNYNRPDFIEMQYKTFKKFLTDKKYHYVVFNDAQNEEMSQQIETMCATYGIRCIRMPQEIHNRPYIKRGKYDHLLGNANIRHANCVQYSLDLLGYDHDGVVFIVDSDVVLIRPFSIDEYMADKDIAGRLNRPCNKAYYFSPLFCMIHMNRIPDKRSLNFNCGTINEVPGDTGAWSYYYLLEHPDLKTVPVRMTFSHQLFLADKHINAPENNMTSDDSKRGSYEHFGFNNTEIDFLLKKPDTFEFYLDNNFFHYRGVSYTTGDAYKLKIFREFIDTITQDSYTANTFN